MELLIAKASASVPSKNSPFKAKSTSIFLLQSYTLYLTLKGTHRLKLL